MTRATATLYRIFYDGLLSRLCPRLRGEHAGMPCQRTLLGVA